MPYVNSIGRAVQVLEAIGSRRDGPVSLGELGRMVQVPKSSLHDICQTLAHEGLLHRDPSGAYSLGVRLVHLGRSYRRNLDLVNEFKRVCASSPGLAKYQVSMAALSGSSVVYVAFRNGRDTEQSEDLEVGVSLPASCTASGKAQLSLLSRSEVHSRYSSVSSLPKRTRHSIVDIDALLQDLEATRHRGYSVDLQESALGVYCVGAAVSDESGRPVVGVAIALREMEGASPRLEEPALAVKELAGALSAIVTGVAETE